MKSTYAKYDKVRNAKSYTGADVAREILKTSGIQGVGVQQISGDLTDNYNSHTKILSLSETTYDKRSVAALGGAAHECGHAVQDHKNYLPLQLRLAIVPVANFGLMAAMPLILIGIVMEGVPLFINLGIICFSFPFLFQVVTLPVEFNTSRRALAILEKDHLLNEEELTMAKKVLFAAALTYVASAIAVFLQLLRLILIFGRRRD